METSARMTFLSFLAYSDCLNPDLASLERNVANDVLEHKDELGIEEISWGPVGNQGSIEWHSDSLMYIVKDSIDDGYTLVIRGTNPVSISSWALQDLMVSGLTPWSRQSGTTQDKNAYISKATDNAMAIHKSLASGGLTVLDWLLKKISDEGSIKLNVTGHSLGGLMSTTFANYLLDELASRSLCASIDCRVYALAGPTAGNGEYARQLQLVLGDKYICYANRYDIATHVWDENDMVNLLPVIYAEKGIYPGKYETMALNSLTRQITGLGYAKLSRVHEINEKLIPYSIFKDYILQAVFQHIFPYLIWALTPTSVKIVERILEILRDLLGKTEIALSDDGKTVSGADKDAFFADARAQCGAR